jgi:hypothetical protein
MFVITSLSYAFPFEKRYQLDDRSMAWFPTKKAHWKGFRRHNLVFYRVRLNQRLLFAYRFQGMASLRKMGIIWLRFDIEHPTAETLTAVYIKASM